jgi:tetratricopeptide (TPR) repeat protein
MATELDPKLPAAHTSWGVALWRRGTRGAAIRHYRTAIAIDPNQAEAHFNLGDALLGQGKAAEAAAEFRTGLRGRPREPEVHYGLGIALQIQGKQAEAEAEYRAALRLRRDYPEARYNLGIALEAQGKHAGAEAEYREALRLRPDYPEPHCNLGGLAERQGRFAEALAAYTRGHALGSQQPSWRYPSAQWVQRAEHLVALDAKLARVLGGVARPADAAERMELAWLCHTYKNRFAAAARFYGEAFKADAKLATEDNRHRAACAAALAASGRGVDAGRLGAPERARVRRQALDWLRANLASYAKRAEGDSAEVRASVREQLRRWKGEADLAEVRAQALTKLPEGERQPWRSLWAEVEQLLGNTREEGPQAGRPARHP